MTEVNKRKRRAYKLSLFTLTFWAKVYFSHTSRRPYRYSFVKGGEEYRGRSVLRDPFLSPSDIELSCKFQWGPVKRH